MGSGRSTIELKPTQKKDRDRRRREKVHGKRLQSLGVSDAVIKKLTSKEKRQMLGKPLLVKKQVALAAKRVSG